MEPKPDNTFSVSIDGVNHDLGFCDDQIHFITIDNKDTWEITDIIGFEEQRSTEGTLSGLILHIVQEGEKNSLTDKTISLLAEESACSKVAHQLSERIDKVAARPKKLLVLINAIGGGQTGEQQYKDIVAPLFRLAKIETDVFVSERPKHFLDILDKYDFKTVNGVVICGGDGTVNECIQVIYNCAQEKAGIDYNNPNFAEITPFPLPITQIPTGTGNGFSVVSCGARDMVTSALHVIKGIKYYINLHGVYCDGRLISYYATVMMFGIWADLFNYIDKHRWLKTMRYLVLPFYYFLFKRIPQYDMELTLYRKKGKSDLDDMNEQNQDSKEVTDTIREEVINLSKTNHDPFTEDFYYATGKKTRNFDCTVLNIFKPCRRTQLLSQLFQFMITWVPETFVKDYIRNERLTGFKAKILNDGQTHQQPMIINLDGEIFELPKPEFQVTWKDITSIFKQTYNIDRYMKSDIHVDIFEKMPE